MPKTEKPDNIKRHILTTIIIFLLLNILDLIGGIINNNLGIANGLENFFDSILVKILLTAIFFLTTFIHTRIDLSLRGPILRTILWSMYLINNLILNPPVDEDPTFIFNQSNSNLSSLYDTFLHVFSLSNTDSGIWMGTIFPGMIIVPIFEIILIKISDILSLRIYGSLHK